MMFDISAAEQPEYGAEEKRCWLSGAEVAEGEMGGGKGGDG